jgi:hypothetical protein
MKLRLAPILLALAAVVPAPTASAQPEVVDQGSFIYYLGDKAVGAEKFVLETRGDSLNVFSQTYQTIRTERGEEALDKQMVLVLARHDFGIRSYQSNQKFRGKELIRGIVMGDTAFTLYREVDGNGEGDRLVLPPGRMYVVDSQLFTLFNVITMSLKDRRFETWPLSMLTLSQRDTLVEATATDLGSESIRWGSRSLQARKLRISDGSTTFTVWANSSGQMIRLVHAETAMRIEREPAARKSKAAESKPRG